MSEFEGSQAHLEAATREFDFESTAEIEVPDSLIEQVIGQEEGVDIIRLAANQKRFVMLMGDPGTGKSMLGQALSECLPSEQLKDIVVLPNEDDPNRPRIRSVPAGEGKELVERARETRRNRQRIIRFLFWMSVVGLALVTFVLALRAEAGGWYYYLGGAVAIGVLFYLRRFFTVDGDESVPKILVNNDERQKAPFVDATGAHAGALFGDVRHDPYQSGGHQTAPHQLVEAGAIHRAHGGVLYIDEVSTLGNSAQQTLLTAIQEKQLPITGRSPGSSGSMVRTQPAPCDFVLVLAGNLEDLEDMHPALRSRIRGYGYEILTNDRIPDTAENHRKMARFVAQEVKKDGKIPHFSADGVGMILRQAHLRAETDGMLTGHLRDLGGLVRAAGDVARMEDAELVTARHVQQALSKVKTIEEQMDEQADRETEETDRFQVRRSGE